MLYDEDDERVENLIVEYHRNLVKVSSFFTVLFAGLCSISGMFYSDLKTAIIIIAFPCFFIIFGVVSLNNYSKETNDQKKQYRKHFERYNSI